MNGLARLYPGDDAVRLAASVAVQIAGIVLFAIAASWTLARRNAALRDGIWKAALALVCVAPIAAWGFQHAGITLWHTPARAAEPRSGIRQNSEVSSEPRPEVSRPPRQTAQPPTPTRSVSEEAPAAPATELSRIPPRGEPRTFETLVGAIAVIWAGGTVLLLVRLIVGLRIVARLRRNLAPFSDLPAGVAERLRRTLGVTMLPPIMISRHIGGPASVGLWRPVVVLPAELTAKMNVEQIHDALAHECAHALRRDARVAIVQQIVAEIYWIHPFVHLLNRQLARAREEVCDNVVLAGTSATEYARTLLALSQTVQSARGRIAVVPMFDPRWRLASRVAGLLNTRRIHMTRMNKATTAMVAAIALILGPALAVVTAPADEPKETKRESMSPVSAVSNPSADPFKSDDANTNVAIQPALGVFSKLAASDRDLAEEDAKLRKALQEPRFEERKAELDLREAKVVVGLKKLLHEKLIDANNKVPGAVDRREVDRAKLDVDVAEIELDKAELELERAQLAVDLKSPPVHIAYSPETWIAGEYQNIVTHEHGFSIAGFRAADEHIDPSVGEMTVKTALEQINAPSKYGPARVAVIQFKGTLQKTLAAADDLKPEDGVLVRDVMEGKAKNVIVHRGDFVVLFGGRFGVYARAAAKDESTPAPKQ